VPAGASTPVPGADVAGRRDGWHRALRRARWYRRSKLFLKRIVGREPWLAPDLDVPLQDYGDWALCSAELRPGDVVYAFGVGKNLAVEVDLVRRCGVEVHAFDPSPESVRWVATQALPRGLHFHALGAAERDGRLTLRARAAESGGAPVMYSAVDPSRTGPAVEVECLALPSLLRRLGHGELALLKMDIEGAEYGVLRGMLESECRPRQILVEFHHRFPGIGPAETASMVRRLRAVGYRLAFVADTGREFTFLKRA
jgi:FkbM family methyltransferase